MVKKRSDQAFIHSRIDGVRVYLEDLEFVLEELRSHGLQVEIRDELYVYDDLNELVSKAGVRPKSVSFEAKGPEAAPYWQLSLTIDRSAARIHARQQGWAYTIRDFLESRVPSHYRIANPWLLYFAVFIPLVPLLQFAGKTKASGVYVPSSWIFAYLLLGIVWLLSIFHRKFDYGVILRRRVDGGFWSRNADKLALSGLSALIGGVVGWVIKSLGIT